MSVKPASSTQAVDFRPEELLGQLKAEQLSRNYDTTVKFIETVLGVRLDACSLRESLRDGVVLCRLINKLRPGAVKRINTRNIPFTQMENISNFLAAAQSLGLDSSDLFQTVDLYEGKNMPRVVMTLLTIARVVAGIPLNSHRKLSDVQRTLGDGWNSTTLTAYESVSLNTPPVEYTSARNQPTLVNAAKPATSSVSDLSESRSLPLVRTPISPRSISSNSSSRRERRRSKRRSAATLFTGGGGSSAESGVRASPIIEASELDEATESEACLRPEQPIMANRPCQGDIGGAEASGTESQSSESIATAAGVAAGAHDNCSAVSAPAPRPRKRASTGAKPRERLTVYSESAQRLTNYQLGNCIGRGQFGSVYRALDLETGQMVAVKQISLEGQDPANMDDVMQEVELLKSLSSPRIVRYHGFVKTDTHLNLVMEFVENGSLSATLKSFGAFPERLVLAYAVKIIEGLICLHRSDVVHCDLKACNILTTKNGNTKLTDFGVSLNLKLRKPDDESVVAGTPYWMAPEIIQLEGACTASDIWSLGCTIIELLTGKPPYSDLMQMAALYRIVEDEHPPIPEGISEELKEFLLQCFRKDPHERPTALDLMSHPWTRQYRRNRKEMKMLRRTCSRKMSSFMARKRSAREYPTFNPAQLKQPVSPTNGAESWEVGDQEDQQLQESVDEDTIATTTTAAAASASTSAAGAPKHTSPESPCLQEGTTQVVSDSDDLDNPAAACGPSDAHERPAVVHSGEETDASISTFEGPRVKRHRLRTILCDADSVCAICARKLSGAFVQCTSCKIRCHDACTRQLQPCTAMRMSRFLYPATRKSSKRYESKTPKIRLRPGRRSTMRRQHVTHTPPMCTGQAAGTMPEMFGSICSLQASGVLGSSDGSLRLTNSKQGMVHDGFDGVMANGVVPARPASIATAMSLPVECSHLEAAMGRARDGSVGRSADSGWETDDAGETGPPGVRSAFMQDRRRGQPNTSMSAVQASIAPAAGPVHQQGPAVARISIPPPRRRNGPFSAPLAAGSARERGTGGASRPLYYQSLAGGAGGPSVHALPATPASITPLSERSRPRSIRRMRANTASLEYLPHQPLPVDGSSQERNSISTLFRRRQHPLREATSSDIRAVAGFSPGAAQRAKRTFHGSDASMADMRSCTTSELLCSESDLGLSSRASTQCFSVTGKHAPSRRFSKDCLIM
ncbi:Protein kinase of the Mitotic Exit Network [Coemansia guatemalensis]|uniref:Protein kinase of the Mitotic Exit Network n=1 Tax=Coemansia guatemalensis TaxID=2761395 RepID=A0A9W8LW38_9FUNG|nr:Protein kinase of the Mitotic Exit Network [Coemansia guatemalensis]